ncbi:MAG: RsmB/NOP family class I SAM-dependent RNA methyltransferase, partial [Clostridia bacterium]|nr:RsmB/NOP family class I SAM-dependent RNA methyltransferase [Clostridia bacterium]
MNDFTALPAEFAERMKAQFSTEEEYRAFLTAYSRPAERGILVNTLKIPKEEFIKISPFSLEQVPWEENGFYVTEEKIGKHPYHAAGLYYSQEPSAMSVAGLLNVNAGEKVLDLCAAPGGKTAKLAQMLKGEGILVTNEINGDRARILSQNVERLGVKNAVVTSASPDFLAERFPCYFDKILVDAPCSGEGMFKKNEKEALENWSLKNVTACAARQREILSAAARMLAENADMVYSTCTFAPEEDEEQIENFLREHPEFTLKEQKKLYPHEVRGEGHFYAVLHKNGGQGAAKSPKEAKSNLTAKEKALFSDFCKQNLVDFETENGVLYRA